MISQIISRRRHRSLSLLPPRRDWHGRGAFSLQWVIRPKEDRGFPYPGCMGARLQTSQHSTAPSWPGSAASALCAQGSEGRNFCFCENGGSAEKRWGSCYRTQASVVCSSWVAPCGLGNFITPNLSTECEGNNQKILFRK